MEICNYVESDIGFSSKGRKENIELGIKNSRISRDQDMETIQKTAQIRNVHFNNMRTKLLQKDIKNRNLNQIGMGNILK